MYYLFRAVFYFVILVTSLPAFSENLEWMGKEINFGYIEESDGVKEETFRFINRSKKPIEIHEVKVACGCTEAEFPVTPVLPGDTAQIKIFFDPIDRPGKFDKGIYVFFKNEKLPVNLRIKGTVLASQETLKLFYPHSFGALRFDTLELDFGELNKGVKRRDFIDIYNSGKNSVKPIFSSPSPALTFDLEPPEIEPGGKATLVVYLNSSVLSFTGKKIMEIYIELGEEKINLIRAEAVVLP